MKAELLISIIAIATLVACRGGNPGQVVQSEGEGGKLANAPLPVSAAPGAWETRILESAAVKAEVRVLTASEEERTRRQLSEVTWESIENSDLPAGMRLLRPYGAPEALGGDNVVYVVPRLFVQSGICGGRPKVTLTAGGQAIVRVTASLVDGLSPSVASGISSFALPANYVYGDTNSVRGAVSRVLGEEVKLKALPGCPSRIILDTGTDRFEAVPALPKDACPLNQLFELSITAGKAQVQKILEEDLKGSRVRLRAEFDLKSLYIKQITALDWSERFLREQLYHSFVELPFGSGARDYLAYRPQDVMRRLEEILSKEVSALGIDLPKADMVRLYDEIIANHFEAEECHEAEGVCLRLRERPVLSEPWVSVVAYETGSLPATANPVQLEATLQDVASDASRFVVSGENTDDSNKPGRGRHGGLLRPARDGDLVELEISKLIASRREYVAPILDIAVSKLDNPVCVQWGDQPMREEVDYSVCLEWNTECARSRDVCIREEEYCAMGERECVERGVGICVFCCNRVEFVCKQTGRRCAETEKRCEEWKPTSCKTYGRKMVPAGPAPCVRNENQWSKFWKLSELPSIVKTSERPASFDQESLFAGLQVQFTHWEPGITGQFRRVSTVCPLAAFRPAVEQVGDALKIRFRIENNREARCEPFNAWNRRDGREPELTLINQLTRPEKYACGFREEYWNGRIVFSCPKLGLTSSQPLFDTYYPRYEVSGVLRIPGARFVSTDPQILTEKK